MLAYVERISVSPVFVARSAELAELTAALRRAEAGQPQALLIAGDAGVGKTRLLEEFHSVATGRGAVFALGGCVEIGADGLPYAPLVTVLRDLYRELPAEIETAAAASENELAQLLPELGRLSLSPQRRASHDEYGRARLFEHASRFFECLAADRTLVLVLEDLHWSDRSTRELLVYLLRSLRTARVVIVGSYRSDDLHRRHPLRPFLADLERMRTVQRIELDRLARPEVAQQLTGILAQAPEDALLDRIYRRSEGNPFFVEELAASYQQGCSTGLTDSLRDLLMARVETLPEQVQTVLRVLAQGGSTVEYGLLEAVLDLSEDELTPALRTAVDANILRPSRNGDGFCFRHALVRAATPPCSASSPCWSPPTSGSPGWPTTGTTPVTRPAPCPPRWTPAARPGSATPSRSSCRCWSAPWTCGTAHRPRSWRGCAPPTTCSPILRAAASPAAAPRPARR
jgi:predicted ATPase